MELEPEILQRVFKDGSTFKASENYVRRWLHDTLQWSRRKATQAAHKKPENWEEQCEDSFFRKVYVIKKYNMLPKFYVNSDQTQLLYAPGDKMTWTDTNSNQVELIGAEEKRAFTVMVSVACDGTLLPFQAIYAGCSPRSRPSSDAPCYNNCISARFHFKHSGTDTYWSNQKMMQRFVTDILEPHLTQAKEKAG
jgi:hypothetical protein